jgi:hypothetical protein
MDGKLGLHFLGFGFVNWEGQCQIRGLLRGLKKTLYIVPEV